MSLKIKLYCLCITLHVLLFIPAIVFREQLGLWLIAIESMLILSLVAFTWLLKKALQPLEYLETFSNLLKEHEFTSRFSQLNQPDLDRLIDQFNHMLSRLHKERLEIGERKHVFEKLMSESPIGVLITDFHQSVSEYNDAAKRLLNDALIQSEINADDIVLYSFNHFNLAFGLEKIKSNEQQLVTTSEGQRLKVGHYRFCDRGFERSFYLFQEITNDILKSQKEAYEKLIRLMSHEVNNTIAITNSLLESCLNYQKELSASSQEDFNKAIKVVIDRSASLNKFMQGYAEVVKLPKPIKSRFNLTQLLENLAVLFYSKCDASQITLITELQKKIIVLADPHLIEQVIVNIIQNAIEAIEEDSEPKNITIELTQAHDSILLQIIDSGCGISEEIKHQLFTPFFTTKDSGQGVGLMLIDDILSTHQFAYRLANNSNNVGANFKIFFPLPTNTQDEFNH